MSFLFAVLEGIAEVAVLVGAAAIAEAAKDAGRD